MLKIERFADGQIVHPSTTNAEYSSIRVSESKLGWYNGMPDEQKKYSFIRAKNAVISAIVANPELLANVHIQTIEMRESEVSAADIYVAPTSTFAETVARLAKRADANGPLLTVNGERIIRITKVTDNPAHVDVLVAHDNNEEIRAYVAARKLAKANTIPTE